MNREEMRADVIIPVYGPDEKFYQLIARLMQQTVLPHRIIIMNTDRARWENSGAPEQLRALGAALLCEVHHVTKAEFDHGGTRNLGVSFSKTPQFVMMTQDAVPADRYLLEELLTPLAEAYEHTGSKCRGQDGADEDRGQDGAEADRAEVRMTYARQLPGKDADLLERFTRVYNYPEESREKTIGDLPELGIKTYFASNVCAAYDRATFDRLGGFTKRTIFNEDMIYAAGLLKDGGAVRYCAAARVFHSHSYTPAQQFHRNFDLAVSQADHPEVFGGIRSESEGIRMVRKTGGFLKSRGELRLLPRLILLSGAKYLGYRLGKNYRSLPMPLVRALSMNKTYWERTDE